MKHHIIRRTLWAGLEPQPGGPLEPVEATFIYRDSDPYAVTLVFRRTAEHLIVWTFARELLGGGMAATSGDGDVRITPDNDDDERIWLRCSSPSGHAVFAFDRHPLGLALLDTYGLVAVGAEGELIDWDTELAKLRGVA